jgi:hypothetical protein
MEQEQQEQMEQLDFNSQLAVCHRAFKDIQDRLDRLEGSSGYDTDFMAEFDKVAEFVLKGMAKIHTKVCSLSEDYDLYATMKGFRKKSKRNNYHYNQSYGLSLNEWDLIFNKKYSMIKHFLKKHKPKMLPICEKLKSSFAGFKPEFDDLEFSLKLTEPLEATIMYPQEDEDGNSSDDLFPFSVAKIVLDMNGNNIQLYLANGRFSLANYCGGVDDGAVEWSNDFGEMVYILGYHQQINSAIDKFEHKLLKKYKAYFEWLNKSKQELQAYECLMKL